MRFLKNDYFWIAIVVFFIALTPVIFTSNSWYGLDFTETGNIGDTIGGITAPFINIGAAILVYLSFKEQIKANKLLSKESSYNYIDNLFKNAKDEGFINNQLKIILIYVNNQSKYADRFIKEEENKAILAFRELVFLINYYETFFIELKNSSISENLKLNYFQNFSNTLNRLYLLEDELKKNLLKPEFRLSIDLKKTHEQFSENLNSLNIKAINSYNI